MILATKKYIYIYVVYTCYRFSLLDFTEIYNGLFYDLKTENFAWQVYNVFVTTIVLYNKNGK